MTVYPEQKFCEDCMTWVDDHDNCGICPYCGGTKLHNDSTDFDAEEFCIAQQNEIKRR